MTDAEVLALAESQMPREQSERMSELLDRQRDIRLATADRLAGALGLAWTSRKE